MKTFLVKKPLFLIAFLTCLVASQAQTVGIGTTTPDNKSILDIVSTNKGVLIPRIDDTSNVSNPAEGLIIYNKNTQTPYCYNGTRWLSMSGAFPTILSTSTDRITYLITASDFMPVEYPVIGLSHEVTNNATVGLGGITNNRAEFSEFNFTKKQDRNSPSFNRLAAIPTLLTSIEFKVYAAGAVTPYMSYRLKNIIITGFISNGAAVGDPYVESIFFNFENYGFKDVVNNVSYGYNVKTRLLTSY